MTIIEKKMNLFDVDLKRYTLAHCISYDCEMGAGIAKVFNQKYPDMKPYLKRVLKENNLNYPITVTYTGNDEFNTVILNLITKERYWHKPTYDTITQSIKDMKDICECCNVKYLAMPKIGCGLDRLSWGKVREMITEIFEDTDIEILVCYI